MKNDPTVVVVVLLRKPGSLRKRGRYCKPTKIDRGPLSFRQTTRPGASLFFLQPKRKGHQSSQFHKEKGSVQCSWYPRTPRSFQASQIPNVHNSFNVLHKVPDMNPQPEKHHPYPHFSPFTLAFAPSANICRLPMFAGPALQNKTTKTILAHCGYRWYHIQVQSLH